ncbi:MAG: sigma-54-dependent Fis family transcriptional regulator [Bacteroidales bacterium]|nr:sigma-54-dependent Fis family transcriptional regulator [Bacteroidales bacterium]
MHKLLIVDDEQSVRYSFKKLFNSSNYKISEAGNADEAIAAFSKEKPNLVILDIEMPGKDGIQVLKEIKELSPKTPVIIITAYGSGDRVIKAMKYGAYEYVEKPFDIPRLIFIIEDALKNSSTEEVKTAEDPHRRKIAPFNREETIVGESNAIKEVFKLIGRVATSDASILIVGESGTGKELVARAIHKYSDRANKPFIAINCAAIPEPLLESELFGYEKGAFTGAEKQKSGKFEEANGGTLFLDEIGDMSLSLQAKLLRVLQEGTIERLGSTKAIKVDSRIVAATNRNLENDIISKAFREDLYYRLKVITISLPPLRMRKDDIPLLTQHFLVKHSRGSRNENLSLPPESMQRLTDYHWPGNIRELENVIKRAIILAKGNIISPDLLFEGIEKPVIQNTNERTKLFAYLNQQIVASEGEIYKLAIEEFEKDLLQWALTKSSGNQLQAAKLLGISRVMLHERMEKYKLRENN